MIGKALAHMFEDWELFLLFSMCIILMLVMLKTQGMTGAEQLITTFGNAFSGCIGAFLMAIRNALKVNGNGIAG